MSIDWTTIITTLITSGILITVAGMILYHKQNKQTKTAEANTATAAATNADTEAQKNQIDLSVKFAKDMLDLMEQVKHATANSDVNQTQILLKLDRLEDGLTNVVEYLNGDYQEFLRKKMELLKKDLIENGQHKDS